MATNNEKNFDWKKSPAHLLFLSTFLKPRSPDNHPSGIPWGEVLGELPDEAIERVKQDDYLAVCTLSEILAQQLPDLSEDKLTDLLRERMPTRDLSPEGKKR